MQCFNSNHANKSNNANHLSNPSQRTAALGPDTPILFRESCLEVFNDQSRIVLRRYFEHFNPANAHRAEGIHSLSTNEPINKVISHGQLHIECSDNTPQK
jgi:hypothetical protein